KFIKTYAIIDCRATGYAFIDEDFAHHHEFPLYTLKVPHTLNVIDGCPVSSEVITHITKLPLQIQENHETISLFVTKLGYYPLVLRISWLCHHDMTLHFTNNQVIFDSEFCQQNYLRELTLVQAVDSEVTLSLDAISCP